MDIRKIYQYALQREHEGKNFFERNSARLSHSAAIDAFERLAIEEGKHIQFIELQLKAIDRGDEASLDMGRELRESGFFTNRADLEKLDQSVIEAMVPDLAVLRMAYLIERDFSEFYESAASQAKGQAREVLQMLAGWERGHEQYFKELHDRAFQEYAQMPWGG
jgi:rubrerythrin